MIRNSSAAFIALLLAGCGGGGSDDTAVSANPPAPTATPTPVTSPSPVAGVPVTSPPPAVAPPVAAFPTPTPPIASPGPVTAPTPSPVTNLPAAPPQAPQPPAGSPLPPPVESIPGRVVKAAIASGNGTSNQAYEVIAGTPDKSRDMVLLNSALSAQAWTQQSQPQDYRCFSVAVCGPQNVHAYPFHAVRFNAGITPTGDLSLGQSALWSTVGWQDINPPLTRTEAFVIKDADRLAMDTTIAEWRLEPYFAQLQVSTYQPSNTVFRLCLHLFMNDVRRLSCTLHDKQSGVLRGVQVLDDSAGLGTIEYRTAQ